MRTDEGTASPPEGPASAPPLPAGVIVPPRARRARRARPGCSARRRAGEQWTRLCGDDLVKNSFYLLAATGTQGILGMAFWLLCARLFPAAQVGEATALISACTLLAYFSLLGFNSSLIRYLPKAGSPEAWLNNGLVLCSGASILLAAGYVLLLPSVASRLAFVRHSPIESIGFVAFVTMTALVLLTDSVFIARRQAQYNLLIDGVVQGGTKLALPVALVSAGAFGIFAATGFAAALDVLVSLLLIVWVIGYRPRLRMDFGVIRQGLGFSSANYLASLLSLVPTLVLPIAVIDELGTRPAAFYYIAFSIANLLNAIAYSTCQALFAEGSHGDTDRRILVRRSACLLAGATVPAGLAVAALAPVILSVFGRQYGQHATTTLVVLALGLVPVSACTWSSTLLRVTGQLPALIVSSVAYAATICVLAVWWAGSGLVFVALAWVIGNVVAAVIAGTALWNHRGLIGSVPPAGGRGQA
jgi:O-antigen/teichoic acid export membrane protein